MSSDLKHFFDNRNFVCLIDRLAKRYGKTPSELLRERCIKDIAFDIAVMTQANIEEMKYTNPEEYKKMFGLQSSISNVPFQVEKQDLTKLPDAFRELAELEE